MASSAEDEVALTGRLKDVFVKNKNSISVVKTITGIPAVYITFLLNKKYCK